MAKKSNYDKNKMSDIIAFAVTLGIHFSTLVYTSQFWSEIESAI